MCYSKIQIILKTYITYGYLLSIYAYVIEHVTFLLMNNTRCVGTGKVKFVEYIFKNS